MFTLPAALQPVVEAINRVGRPRVVGGWVRDHLLGQSSGDVDVEVAGCSFDQLQAALSPFGATDVVGRSFGTIKLRRHGVVYDFSLPRRESKTGAGHRGFKVEPDPTLSDRAAASRRDFTLNAIAWDPVSGALIDPFDGAADLRAGILRHTGPAFAEDPLRVLRGMQLAARFELTMAPETVAMSRAMVDTAAELPVERIWGEWDKWLRQARRPSRGLEVLQQTGWIRHFPEIAALVGTPQEPDWHPEGDVFTHTGHCLDALVDTPAWTDWSDDRKRTLMLAVLAHDFGKPATTERVEKRGKLRWTSPGHAMAGVPLAESFLKRIGAPKRFSPEVGPLVQYHMAHIDGAENGFSATRIRRLARKLAPARLTDLLEVLRADALGRPPLDGGDTLGIIDAMRERIEELAVQDSAPTPLILGRDLIQRGLQPGPDFGAILKAAYEAQLNGDFSDEQTSSKWLDRYLKKTAD